MSFSSKNISKGRIHEWCLGLDACNFYLISGSIHEGLYTDILAIRASKVRPDHSVMYISRATMEYFPVFNSALLTLLVNQL
jgi:hypothetical protein